MSSLSDYVSSGGGPAVGIGPNTWLNFLMWSEVQNSVVWTVPEGVTEIRGYAVGRGGSSYATSDPKVYNPGAGGGMAFGSLAVVTGDTLTISDNYGTDGLLVQHSDGRDIFVANRAPDPAINQSPYSPNAPGGTASVHPDVYDGGASTGGAGGSVGAGGSSAGSPLGNGIQGASAAGSGGCGIGGASMSARGSGGGSVGGTSAYFPQGNLGGNGGGAGSGSTQTIRGSDRSLLMPYSDPLLALLVGIGAPGASGNQFTSTTLTRQAEHGGPGAGGGGYASSNISGQSYAGDGGFGAGGGGASDTSAPNYRQLYGGKGGHLGGGGSVHNSTYVSSASLYAYGGDGGIGGGGGGMKIDGNAGVSRSFNYGRGGPNGFFLFFR